MQRGRGSRFQKLLAERRSRGEPSEDTGLNRLSNSKIIIDCCTTGFILPVTKQLHVKGNRGRWLLYVIQGAVMRNEPKETGERRQEPEQEHTRKYKTNQEGMSGKHFYELDSPKA